MIPDEYDDLNTGTLPLKFLQIFRGHEFSKFFYFVNHLKNFPKVATGTRSHLMPELRRMPDYEVCSENNGDFLISRVWRVLLSKFFVYYVGIHAPEV